MARGSRAWTIAEVAKLTGKPAAQIAAELDATPEPTTGSHRVGGRYVQRGTAGKREALNNLFVRSRYEANLGCWLQWQGIAFQYESRVFDFPGCRGKNAFYIPDFYLIAEDRYIEVKGWLDSDSATKLRRMTRWFPEIRIELIQRPWFQAMCRQRSCLLIFGWECRHSGY